MHGTKRLWQSSREREACTRLRRVADLSSSLEEASSVSRAFRASERARTRQPILLLVLLLVLSLLPLSLLPLLLLLRHCTADLLRFLSLPEGRGPIFLKFGGGRGQWDLFRGETALLSAGRLLLRVP